MNTLPHNIVIRSGPRFNVFDEDVRCGWERGTVVAVKIGKSADQTKLIGSLASGCNKATLASSENEPIRGPPQPRVISARNFTIFGRTAISLL